MGGLKQELHPSCECHNWFHVGSTISWGDQDDDEPDDEINHFAAEVPRSRLDTSCGKSSAAANAASKLGSVFAGTVQ